MFFCLFCVCFYIFCFFFVLFKGVLLAFVLSIYFLCVLFACSFGGLFLGSAAQRKHGKSVSSQGCLMDVVYRSQSGLLWLSVSRSGFLATLHLLGRPTSPSSPLVISWVSVGCIFTCPVLITPTSRLGTSHPARP